MTKGHELEGFAGFEPNSFFMCTETSPRCYVIQRVDEMPGCASTDIVDTPLKDVKNGSEPIMTTPIAISTADLAPVADTPGSDTAPTPFLFPWWFTNECRTALLNIPTTSSPYNRPDTSASNSGHSNNHGSPNTNANSNENDSTRSKTPEVLTMEQLRERLKRQLEYYFSRENLINDRYLRCQMDSDRYVPIKTVSTFPKIKQLTSDLSLIVDVLRESKQVQVDESGEKVRPVCKRCTIILRDIGTEEDEDHALQEVRFMFENCDQKYQSIIYGLNNSWYVTFPDEEATKMAFLHLKNLGKTFNGKRLIQPVHARIKDGGPPEANSNRMTSVPSTHGHVMNMFVSPEGHTRIMTTSTGNIVVHELPWEGGGNHTMYQSHRSRSNTNTFTTAMALSTTGEGFGVTGEIGEALRQLGYAPKAVFRPLWVDAFGSLPTFLKTLTPSPAVSPSIANADDPPRCDSLGNTTSATGNALNSAADERLLANSPDSARLSPYGYNNNISNNNNMDVTNKLPRDTDASPDNDSLLVASPENEIEAIPSQAYMLSFGRQRITDAPKINTKGRQSPLFYLNPALAGVVPPAPYFMAMPNGLYADGKMMSSSPNPYYIDQFSAPIISDINPAFYVDYDPSLMIQTDASPHHATPTAISNSPKENDGDLHQYSRTNNRSHRGGNLAFGRPGRSFARAPPAKSPRLAINSGVNAVLHDTPFHDTGHSSPRYRGGGGGGRPWAPHYQRGWKSDEGRHGGPQYGGQYSSRGQNHFNNDSIPSSRLNSSPYGFCDGRVNSNDADSTPSASLIRPRILRNSTNSDHNNHHQHHHIGDVVHANNQSPRPAYENWRPGLSEQNINSSNSNHLQSIYLTGSKNAGHGRSGGKPLSSLFSYPTRLHHHSSSEGSHPDSFLTRSNASQPQQPLQQKHTNIDMSQLRPLSESYGGGTGGVHHPQRSFHQQKHSINGELRQPRLSRFNPRGAMTNGAHNQTDGERVAAVEEVGLQEQLHHHRQHQHPNRPRIERPINQHRLAKSSHHAESEREYSDCGGEGINSEKSAALAEYNFVEIEFPSLLSDFSETGCYIATATQESQTNLKEAERAPSDADAEHACVRRNAATSHKPQFSEIVSGTKPHLSSAVDGTEQPSSPAAAARDDAGCNQAGSENTVSPQALDAKMKSLTQSATKSYAQATQKGPKDE